MTRRGGGKGRRKRPLPKIMRAALKGQTPAFAKEMADRYRAADPATKADILAFFESDGPRKVHEAKLKINDGVPTSADLERQLKGRPS